MALSRQSILARYLVVGGAIYLLGYAAAESPGSAQGEFEPVTAALVVLLLIAGKYLLYDLAGRVVLRRGSSAARAIRTFHLTTYIATFLIDGGLLFLSAFGGETMQYAAWGTFLLTPWILVAALIVELGWHWRDRCRSSAGPG